MTTVSTALVAPRISTGTLAALIVAGALSTSSIVFSEPAIADVLMMGVIVGIPILGVGRMGPATATNLSIWLVIVALGLAGTSFSATMKTAVTHQFVTLFLVVGGAALASYIAGNPEPRFKLVMVCYTLGTVLAAIAAFAGYFRVSGSAYDLFTLFGRARGTFKDPNVLGAALAPAIVYAAWVTLRGTAWQAMIAMCTAALLTLTLLITFSRGAWISAALSLAIMAWFALVTSSKQRQLVRLGAVATLGSIAFVLAVGTLLQVDSVRSLFAERASLDQSYDHGPEGRFGGQQKARTLILENPLGIGTHTFRDVHHTEEPHNVYLSTFLNTGWLGGLLYVISVLMVLTLGLRSALRTTPVQGPLIVASAAFLGLVVEGFVIDTDHWRHFFILMALITGLADGAARRGQSGAEAR